MRVGVRSAFLSLVLAAAPSWAQRVSVLEFEDDAQGRMRHQVERAVQAGREVEVVPLPTWKGRATEFKFRGSDAYGLEAISRIAPDLRIDAVVKGRVGAKLGIEILDSTGAPLWSKGLKLKGGKLSADFAKKLARAIAVAAKTAPPPAPVPQAAPAPEEPSAQAVAEDLGPRAKVIEIPAGASGASDEVTGQPALDLSSSPRDDEGEATRVPVTPRYREEHRDTDLETEGRQREVRIGPKALQLGIAGTTTWRFYCAFPGVDSCAEALANEGKITSGDGVQFTSSVPYAGFLVNLSLFPFAPFTTGFGKGLGLLGQGGIGFSQVQFKTVAGASQSAPKVVSSRDIAWSAQLAYRFFFGIDLTRKGAVPGYVGLRGGVGARIFEIASDEPVALPGSHRFVYPQGGVDVSLPLVTFLRLEGAFSFFIAPKPGLEEIIGFGDPNDPTGGATAFGLSFEGGLAGDLWGPLGYSVRYRYSMYNDHFFGRGNKWTTCNSTSCGGAAEERYHGLVWGLTLNFF